MRRIASAALVAALFLLVVGANCDTLDRYGSDMPNMDQFDAEGVHLLLPWFRHDHFWSELFVPQNEHRVVLTKLQDWLLVVSGGQWDARAQSLCNAVLHGFIAIGLWLLACRFVRGIWMPLTFVAIACLYALPLAWQNLLGGFHSQQYWLILLSAAAIVSLPFARVGTARWWCGVAATILAMGAMASGFLAAAVVLVMIAGRRVAQRIEAATELPIGLEASHAHQTGCSRGPQTPVAPASAEAGYNPRLWLTATFAVTIVLFGWLTRHEVDYHAALKAKSGHDFVFTVLRSLEWPLADHDSAGILLWAPWAGVVVFLVRRSLRRRHSIGTDASENTNTSTRGMVRAVDERTVLDQPWAIFGLGGWVLLQVLATAYARGAGGGYPSSRYLDTLMFGTAVNLIALGWLCSRSSRGAGRSALIALTVAWCLATAVGLFAVARRNISTDMPVVRSYFRGAEAHLRAYLASGDAAELVPPIPYLDAPRMVERIAAPELRAILPQSVRPPLQVVPATGAGNFPANFASQRRLETEPQRGLSPETQPLPSRPTWGSFNERGRANTGLWTSQPITASLGGWLKFETAGNLGEPGVSLELRDAASNTTVARIVPSKVPGVSWRSVYVRAPTRPFTIVATDEDRSRWLAFSAPVEMSSFSYDCWRVVKNGRVIFEGAIVLILIAGIAFVGADSFATTSETGRR